MYTYTHLSLYAYIYIYTYIHTDRRHQCVTWLPQMGARWHESVDTNFRLENKLPRNFRLLPIVKPSGRHCTDAHAGTNIRRVPTLLETLPPSPGTINYLSLLLVVVL